MCTFGRNLNIRDCTLLGVQNHLITPPYLLLPSLCHGQAYPKISAWSCGVKVPDALHTLPCVCTIIPTLIVTAIGNLRHPGFAGGDHIQSNKSFGRRNKLIQGELKKNIMAMSRNHTVWKVCGNFWWKGTTHQSKILVAVPTCLVDWERQESGADKRVNWIALHMQTT
jgi:hypothetical protein